MPEFELSVTPCDGDAAAFDRLGPRYPEIDVVGRYRSTDTAVELWLCRAPSVAHVERWVDETDLRVIRIRRLAEP
jgi:hypothetical protein